MVKRRNTRRVRKRRGSAEKTKMKFVSVLVIMIIAIALGYATARFIIGPILGYETDESPITISQNDKDEQKNEDTSTDESEEKSKKDKSKTEASTDAVEDGYALQFGVFSTKEAAQKLVNSLQEKGVDAKIVESNNQYKVISPIIKTKDEALNKLNEIKDKEVEDVFIASF